MPEWPKGAVCKTVGSAYDGSNPSPATTSTNGLWPGISPGPRAVMRCVSLCHRRSGDVAARRWLRTHSGQNRAGASGSPNRLPLDFDDPPSSVNSPPGPGRSLVARRSGQHQMTSIAAASEEGGRAPDLRSERGQAALLLQSPLWVYRFRTRRRCCDLRFGWMSRMGQDRGSCLFACST